MHEHGNEMPKHDQIWWTHKITYQTKLDNTFNQKNCFTTHENWCRFRVLFVCYVWDIVFIFWSCI